MKRKVIQIAGSTQLVSLPRKWAKMHNIQKGDEVDVQENSSSVIITPGQGVSVEKVEVDINNLKKMTLRFIHSMYKRGVDELKLHFSDSSMLKIVQVSIGKDAVGYEILEHSKNHCTIKYVAGNIEKFDLLLRRTFLMLVNMSDESYEAIRGKEFEHLNNIAFLEQANNRFTAICRRYLNKNGAPKNYGKIGPLYFIIESLERIADEYKYICKYLAEECNAKTVINRDVLGIYERTKDILKGYYEIFYKFDLEKIAQIKEIRDDVIARSYVIIKKKLLPVEFMMVHHGISVTNTVFGMIDPYLVLSVNVVKEEISD